MLGHAVCSAWSAWSLLSRLIQIQLDKVTQAAGADSKRKAKADTRVASIREWIANNPNGRRQT